MLKRLISMMILCGAGVAAEPVMLSVEEHGDWQAIGRLNSSGYRDTQMCTATLVAPDRVVTAKHCLRQSHIADVTSSDLVFVAGWFRGDYVARAEVVSIDLAPASLFTSEASSFAKDVALLHLAEPLIDVAFVPLAKSQLHADARILGYRWDRPHALSDSGACPRLRAPRDVLFLDCPVTFGTSGAPVLEKHANGWRVVGIVSAKSGDDALAAAVPEDWIANTP